MTTWRVERRVRFVRIVMGESYPGDGRVHRVAVPNPMTTRAWPPADPSDNSTPEGKGEIIEIEVPEIEFNGADPLHRGAIQLQMDRTDALNEAMLLLQKSKNPLTVMQEVDPGTPVAVCETKAKDVYRRARKALKALDKQEFADRDVYLAFAETQRK